jgi:hypothetical protein
LRLRGPAVLVYLGFVGAAVLLLHFTPLRFIDYEEADYGELPIAIVDGLVGAENLAQFQTFPREGSMLFWALPVALVFRLIGPSLFALKLSAILLSGLWAVVWFRLARMAFPRAPAVLVAVAWVLPVPLVQISSVSATSIMTHLGSTLWHGVALLALWLALTGQTARSRWGGIASGIACGLGTFCGYSIVPLIPGVIWTAVRGGRPELLRGWATGVLPPLVLAIATFTPEGIARIDPEGQPAGPVAPLLERMVLYGAGVYVGEDVATGARVYSPVAVVYPLLLAAVVAAGRFAKPRTAGGPGPAIPSRALVEGVLLSTLGLGVALWITGYRLPLWAFDGLRYLVPLAAPLTLLLIGASSRLPRAASSSVLGVFVLLNAAAHVSLLHPFRPAPFLHLVRGYRGTFFLHVDYSRRLSDLEVPESHRLHYAVWMGAADTLRGDLEVGPAARLSGPPLPEVMAEYWRGVGLAQALGRNCLREPAGCVPEGTPPSLVPYAWQGVGSGSDCDGWRDLRARVPPAHRDDFTWGAGRASVLWGGQCQSHDGSAPFQAGIQAGWRRDLAVAGREADLLARLAVARLPVYAWYGAPVPLHVWNTVAGMSDRAAR